MSFSHFNVKIHKHAEMSRYWEGGGGGGGGDFGVKMLGLIVRKPQKSTP